MPEPSEDNSLTAQNLKSTVGHSIQSSSSRAVGADSTLSDSTKREEFATASSEMTLEEQKLKLEEQKLRLEEQRINLDSYRKEIAFRRTVNLVQQSIRGSAGIVMLGAGIMFTAANNMLGPYMLGIGVAATSTSVKEAAKSVRSLNHDEIDE